jgi:hypothetical protein
LSVLSATTQPRVPVPESPPRWLEMFRRPDSGRVADVRRRATQAETRLRRLQQAIEAGASPAALVEPINRAQQERDAAEDELARLPVGVRVGRAEVEAMVDSLSVLGRQVNHASPARLQELYGEIGLEMVYNAKERMIDVTILPPRRVNACVRGGICTLTTRLALAG